MSYIEASLLKRKITEFNNKLRTMSPDDFISQILDSINLVSFTVGDDFRFGAPNRKSSPTVKLTKFIESKI